MIQAERNRTIEDIVNYMLLSGNASADNLGEHLKKLNVCNDKMLVYLLMAAQRGYYIYLDDNANRTWRLN